MLFISKSIRFVLFLLLLHIVFIANAYCEDMIDWPKIDVELIAEGFTSPLFVTHSGDGTGRLFVIEQKGVVKILARNGVYDTPFLDITSKVSCCGERGLLSIAFPPAYASKGYFYVNYTNISGNSIIARYYVTGDPDVADPMREDVVLTIDQPFDYHNAGQLFFGPNDGYLYIGVGDGGSDGNLLNNGQNKKSLLGEILRIDVESEVFPYSIPLTNPFINQEDFLDEIWAYGLRNPWRFSFDKDTGDFYIGDVGQNLYEEIDFQPAQSSGGGELWMEYNGGFSLL